MKVAYSPCPNDTFIFHAWAKGLVGNSIDPQLLDIQHLNQAAQLGTYPVCKVSFYCLGHILDDYIMLPVGAALGMNCGQKIVAKKPFALEELLEKTIAVPGQDTTAHLLLQLLAPKPKKKIFCLYHETLDQNADCAVLLHEQRFTFQEKGYVEIADLGELWHQRYGVPIPLGCIVAKRSLGNEKIQEILDTIQASLKQARKETPFDYIRKHCQEPKAIDQHLELYVNKETEWLSAKGMLAIETLLAVSREKGLMPPSEKRWLF